MSRLTLALALPALLLGACVADVDGSQEELEFRNDNKDADIVIHEGDNTDNPACILWDIKDSCAHEADEGGVGEFLNLHVGDDLVDLDDNVLCSIEGGDLIRASDDELLLTLHGNRLEDPQGNTLHSFAADHVFNGHINNQSIGFTATDNLSKGTKARKLQIGTLILGIEDCIARGSHPPDPPPPPGGDDGRTGNAH
jgi:hypothetical protein